MTNKPRGERLGKLKAAARATVDLWQIIQPPIILELANLFCIKKARSRHEAAPLLACSTITYKFDAVNFFWDDEFLSGLEQCHLHSAFTVVRRKLKKEGIVLKVKGEPKAFNDFHFRVLVDFYNMKGNDAYSYNLSLHDEQPSWGYSQQAIDLILQEIRRDPEHVIDSMRAELSKKNP